MKRLLNVAVLTRDLDAALAAWERASGLKGRPRPFSEPAAAGDGRASIDVGGVSIDLVCPASQGPLHDALEERGDGLHWLIIETDAFTDTVDSLRSRGVALSEIAVGPDGVRGVLLDPASTHGVPIRFMERRPEPVEGARPEPVEGARPEPVEGKQ